MAPAVTDLIPSCGLRAFEPAVSFIVFLRMVIKTVQGSFPLNQYGSLRQLGTLLSRSKQSSLSVRLLGPSGRWRWLQTPAKPRDQDDLIQFLNFVSGLACRYHRAADCFRLTIDRARKIMQLAPYSL